MKKILHWLKRAYYKIWNYDGALYVHSAKGKWRVLYPDGKRSQKFSYRVAKDYAEMFGGKVIEDFN